MQLEDCAILKLFYYYAYHVIVIYPSPVIKSSFINIKLMPKHINIADDNDDQAMNTNIFR